ncbi:hypothetical protein LTR29_004639 [Friedmanniomyces endolithicus]|nr:hypothetical protein LTR29_004639 [Friedmanniomyces endolithicus]
MSYAHLSDPHQYRESVLSTRSLSFLSTVDGLGLSGRSRSGSLTQPTRRRTMHDDSEHGEDLIMANTEPARDTDVSDMSELPASVAHSHLFALPRELRDKIYAFCLTAQDDLSVEWPRLAGTNVAYSLEPQLLRACRIIYDEAGPLLYSLNTLTFHHPSDANMFVRAFASASLSRRHIANLALHLKSADTRLWMPYLTSTDAHRSLKADFPYLRELGVRYRSNRWNHSHGVDVNLKDWRDDSRLDEIIDGLRHIYYPPPPPRSLQDDAASRRDGEGAKPLNEMNAQESIRFVETRRPGEDIAFKRQLLEMHKAHAPNAMRLGPPTIKVVCACRVHSTHFAQLTTPPADSNSGLRPHRARPAAPMLATIANLELTREVPSAPVVDGEPFRGFTAIDFLTMPVRRLEDPDLGTAKVARTPFADRQKILIALEIHCLDSRSQSRDRR